MKVETESGDIGRAVSANNEIVALVFTDRGQVRVLGESIAVPDQQTFVEH